MLGPPLWLLLVHRCTHCVLRLVNNSYKTLTTLRIIVTWIENSGEHLFHEKKLHLWHDRTLITNSDIGTEVLFLKEILKYWYVFLPSMHLTYLIKFKSSVRSTWPGWRQTRSLGQSWIGTTGKTVPVRTVKQTERIKSINIGKTEM